MCSISAAISPFPMLNKATGGKASFLDPISRYTDPATLVSVETARREDKRAAQHEADQRQRLAAISASTTVPYQKRQVF